MAKIPGDFYLYQLKRLKERLDSTSLNLESMARTIQVLLENYDIDVKEDLRSKIKGG